MILILFFILICSLNTTLYANEFAGKWKVLETENCRYDISIDITESAFIIKDIFVKEEFSIGKIETSTTNDGNYSSTYSSACDFNQDKSKLLCIKTCLNTNRDSGGSSLYYTVNKTSYAIDGEYLTIETFNQNSSVLPNGENHLCTFKRVQ